MMTRREVPEFTIEQVQKEFEKTQPVLQIIAERRENGDYWERRSTYDRFMCDYVGDPLVSEKHGQPQHSPIRRMREGYGEVDYDKRYLASYTQEGHLVHVRKTSAIKGEVPEAYFVVTGDIDTGEVTEWRVTEVDYSVSDRPGRTADLRQKLTLSKRFLRGLDVAPEMDEGEIDPVKALISYWKRRSAYEAQQQESPSLELTSQGCWLNLPGGKRESLAPIAGLHHQLEVYERHYKQSHDEYLQAARAIGSVAILPRQDEMAAHKALAKKERSFTLVNNLT